MAQIQVTDLTFSYDGSADDVFKDVTFDYFPHQVSDRDLTQSAEGLFGKWKPQVEEWQVLIQINELKMDPA